MVAVVVYGYRSVVVYGSSGGIWIRIGGIWQRWWDMATTMMMVRRRRDNL